MNMLFFAAAVVILSLLIFRKTKESPESLGTMSAYDLLEKIKSGKTDINAVDAKGNSALFYAAMGNKDPGVIKLLAENGADVEKKGEDGDTPLMRAIFFNDNIEIMETLIELGADVNARNEEDVTPLHICVVYEPLIDKMKTLFKYNVDINARNDEGMTPLMFAAHCATADGIKVLVENGADITLKDNYGETAFDKLMNNEDLRNSDSAKKLLQFKGDKE